MAKPAKAAKAAKPAKLTRPAKPPKPVEPAKLAKPVEAAKSSEMLSIYIWGRRWYNLPVHGKWPRMIQKEVHEWSTIYCMDRMVHVFRKNIHVRTLRTRYAGKESRFRP